MYYLREVGGQRSGSNVGGQRSEQQRGCESNNSSDLRPATSDLDQFEAASAWRPALLFGSISRPLEGRYQYPVPPKSKCALSAIPQLPRSSPPRRSFHAAPRPHRHLHPPLGPLPDNLRVALPQARPVKPPAPQCRTRRVLLRESLPSLSLALTTASSRRKREVATACSRRIASGAECTSRSRDRS